MKNEKIQKIWFEGERIYMRSDLNNEYSRPLEAFPILKSASEEQRLDYKIRLQGEALRWESIDEDIHISAFYEDNEPQEHNPVAALFAQFPQLNVSEVAKSLGMHKSLLSQYIYGVKKPSEARMKEIKEALNKLGRQLIEATT